MSPPRLVHITSTVAMAISCLVGAMVFVTRFGWTSPRYPWLGPIRIPAIVVISLLLAVLIGKSGRLSRVDIAVIAAILAVLGLLLLPGFAGGKLVKQDYLW